jgi:membrane protein implicated in regulation of membrane protease activity
MKTQRQLIAAIASIMVLAMPATAFAYVGPGAGLSLVGAFWALLLAVATALFFLLAWPVRRMLRHARARGSDLDRQTPASGQRVGERDDPLTS